MCKVWKPHSLEAARSQCAFLKANNTSSNSMTKLSKARSKHKRMNFLIQKISRPWHHLMIKTQHRLLRESQLWQHLLAPSGSGDAGHTKTTSRHLRSSWTRCERGTKLKLKYGTLISELRSATKFRPLSRASTSASKTMDLRLSNLKSRASSSNWMSWLMNRTNSASWPSTPRRSQASAGSHLLKHFSITLKSERQPSRVIIQSASLRMTERIYSH